ncbi:MAG: hypothetical protein IPK80_00080 [Nannocystis sp.]|nr:hypothetical protein [Nannocystis sp.]
MHVDPGGGEAALVGVAEGAVARLDAAAQGREQARGLVLEAVGAVFRTSSRTRRPALAPPERASRSRPRPPMSR